MLEFDSAIGKGLQALLDDARSSLLLVSPFVGREGVELVSSHLERKTGRHPKVDLVTNLDARHIIDGATDIRAILHLTQAFPEVQVTHLPNLHAKVFVSDTRSAVVTSANLTQGGLGRNLEYGVFIRGPQVAQIRRDMQSFASLGALVTKEEIAVYAESAEEARKRHGDAVASARRAVRNAFQQSLREANDRLLEIRAQALRRMGESVNSLFSRTIFYLLGQHGPLTTVQLHPLVQQMHPDICDDTIDRVISGERYGKLWKHRVRSAQTSLRRRGDIDHDGRRWFLTA